jgi:hypothetical protein
MSDIFLLQNLRRKRAVLQGQIEAQERQLRLLRGDLETIDRMIRLIDAGTDPKTIKGIRPSQRMEGFRQGEVTRLTYTVLRDAAEPLSTRQIAEGIAELKGVPFTSDIAYRTLHNLSRLARRGTVRKLGIRRSLKWALPL